MTKDEALRMALDALEHEAEIGNDDAYRKERDAIRKALAQPEQEPFAYLDPGLGAFYWAREYPDGPPPGFEPVYLAGSNKRWVGLTDEEIAEMHNEIKVRLMGTYRTEDIYRAIEAKLKEKNT